MQMSGLILALPVLVPVVSLFIDTILCPAPPTALGTSISNDLKRLETLSMPSLGNIKRCG